MNFCPVTYGSGSLHAGVNMIKRAENLLLNASGKAAEGDLLESALLTLQAQREAEAGAAISRVANEVSGMIVDILA